MFHNLLLFTYYKVSEPPNKFQCFYNPGQNIWKKVKKFSKIGQDKKALISSNGYFLSATANPPKFEDFLIHHNSKDHESYVVGQLVRQFLHQVCGSRYQVWFYLWLIRPMLRRCKVLKYYYQDSLVFIYLFIYFLLSTNDDWSFWKKLSFDSKKLVLSKSEVESFLKSNFDLNKVCEILLT